LTPGEIAEIAGVVAAIVGVCLGPLLHRVRRHRVELAELEARITRAERVGELVCKAVTRGLVGVDNTLDWSAGLIHRILLHRDHEIDTTRAIEEMRAIRFAVERASAEVLLLAGTRREQVSALQQLTYRVGGAETLATLNEIAKLGGLEGSSEATLRAAHIALTERLINGGRQQ